MALNRVAVYLDEDEVSDQVSSLKKTKMGPYLPGFIEHEGLGIENGSFKWNEVEEEEKKKEANPSSGGETTFSMTVTEEMQTQTQMEVDDEAVVAESSNDHRFELRDISVRFPESQLTLVTGPTASGKTALLVRTETDCCLEKADVLFFLGGGQMALLGEMTLLPGGGGRIIMSKEPSQVDKNGLMHSISYAAQLPWLRHQSIRDNVLFGQPFDEERYNAVMECCALKPDLEILEDGDATEIGAR